MNTKNVILATAIATVLLIAAVGSASAADCGAGTAKPVCECGDTVKGDFTFTADMTCTNAAQNGLIIGASGITIDGAGYSMTGNVASATCTAGESNPCETHSGIVNVGEYDNVVVKNVEIKDFCTGIAMGKSTVDVDHMTVTDCVIHDCGDSVSITHGIHLSGANHCTIKKNEIYNIDGTADMGDCGSGGNGICMFGGDATGKGDWNNITCNHLHNNAKCGLHSKKKCMHNIISYNNASGNAGAGIMPECKKTDWNTFQYNTMSNNGFGGFYTCGNNNTISYNTLTHNGYSLPDWGMGLEINAGYKMGTPYGTNNDVTNNTVCDSSGDDIVTTNNVPGNTNTVESNTCDILERGGVDGSCDWSCGSLTTVYYDFDGDGDCSKKAADCSCNNTLDVGSCCNPGKFNSSGANNHCAACQCCNTNEGHDTNDCNGIPSGDPVPPVPELPTLVLLSIGLLMLAGYVVLGKRRKE